MFMTNFLKQKVQPYLALTLLTFLLSHSIFPFENSPVNLPDPDFSELKNRSAKTIAPVSTEKVRNSLGNLPIAFEVNRGQLDKAVKFYSRGNDHSLYLTPREAVLNLTPAKAETIKSKNPENGGSSPTPNSTPENARSSATIRMKLVRANSNPKIEGLDQLKGKSNYFTGADPQNWKSDISSFSKVKYTEVYKGIDLVYYGKGGLFEYDFIVAPGRNPNKIKLEFNGAKNVRLDKTGNLVLETGAGDLIHNKPVIYQEIEGKQIFVEGSFAIKGRRVGFQIGKYDKTKPLIIDPSIVYSTYLGGNLGHSQAKDVAVYEDAQTGLTYAYVVGTTNAANFPTKAALQPVNNGPASSQYPAPSGDVFLMKLDLAQSGAASVVFSTFLGGTAGEGVAGIKVDSAGNAYIAGTTASTDFPTVNSLPTPGGGNNAFVAKVNANGSSLIYSTYLGGSADDSASGIAIDGSGNAYVGGMTSSANLPTVNALQTNAGSMFVAKIAPPTGNNPASLLYSTYLSGGAPNGEGLHGIAADSNGNAYVVGWTTSHNFPVTPNAFQTANRSANAFIAKINTLASGNASLVYSTYVGGAGRDFGGPDRFNAVTADNAGNAYVTGQIWSPDFPLTPGSYRPPPALHPDYDNYGAIVAKFDTTKSGAQSLVYASHLGRDEGNAVAIDAAGNAYVAGLTRSADFPLVNPVSGYSGGLYFTDNEGGKINALNKGFLNNTIAALSVDTSTTPRTLYVALRRNDQLLSAVMRSSDGGVNWTPIDSGLPTGFDANALTLDPTNPMTIYLGTMEHGVYKSTDQGGTWTQINNGLNLVNWDPVYFLTFDKDLPTPILYAGTEHNLYKSTDRGATWTPTERNQQTGGELFINTSTTPHTLFNYTERSTDGGNTWTPITLPTGPCWNPASTFAHVVGIDNSTSPSTIYLSEPNAGYFCETTSFFKSTDNGETWQEASPYNQAITKLVIDTTTSPSTLYAGVGELAMNASGVAKSTDGGNTFNFIVPDAKLINVDGNGSASPTVYIYGDGMPSDAFVAKLNPTGSSLLFSTYLGGLGNHTLGSGIAVDSQGSIYVVGATSSQFYPVTNAFQSTSSIPAQSAFLTKMGSAALPPVSAEAVTKEVALPTGSLEMTFPNITGSTTAAAPTTSVDPIDSTAAANLTLSNNLGAYEIKTTATFDTTGYATDPTKGIKLTFNIPVINDPATFDGLVVTHGEDQNGDGIFQSGEMIPYNGTIDPQKITYHDFATRTIWVYVPSFSPFVIVKGVKDQIGDLIDLTDSFNLKQGIQNSLDAKLQNALRAYQAARANDRTTACSIMRAFNSEVQSQSGRSITSAQAQQLTNSAKQIQVVLACG